MSRAATSPQGLDVLLRYLKLPSFIENRQEVARAAEKEGWSFETYLRQLVEIEASERKERRLARMLKASGLPLDKTLDVLDAKRLPVKVQRQLPNLCTGAFLKEATNVLAFGLPGRGKSHLLSAIGHELIARGHRVLFRPTALLVQQLLAAKRDLRLEHELKRLDGFEAVILDDIGYVQQDREEMEVLFTFLAARYERRSVLITSNLVFSEWERIFKDPMTTAAAIDRLVHHSVILELTGPSLRAEAAKSRGSRATSKEEALDPTTTSKNAPTKKSKRAEGPNRQE